MQFTKKQLDLINRKKLVILATSNLSHEPRAIIVEVNKTENNKIIITDNQMGATRENLLKNKKVFLLIFEDDYHYGLKVSGEAEYFTKGDYFNLVKNAETNKGYSPKGAVVITASEINEFE